MNDIKDAVLEALALKGAVLAAKQDYIDAQEKFHRLVKEAKQVYDTVVVDGKAEVERYNQLVAEAEQKLSDHQRAMKEQFNIIIDLTEKPAGGSTRL